MDGKELGYEPAYPAQAPNGDTYSGLTKREKIAALMAAASSANSDVDMEHVHCAEWSCKRADAILEELAKDS